jgi:hypothetical protein
VTNTLTGMLLAATAGLNAFIPLLGLAMADRFTTFVELETPYGFISSTLSILILLLLVTVELVVDKIPRIDLLNDLINTAVRPAAGGFLLMAVTHGQGNINLVIAMMLGLTLAGVVHAVKAISRTRITVATKGVGNPIVSMVEDGIAGLITLLAILLPWLGLVAAIGSGVFLGWFYRTVTTRSLFMSQVAGDSSLRQTDSTLRIHSVKMPESMNAED